MFKIVHLGKYYPPDFGGMESVTETLAEGAQLCESSVTVICFDKGNVGSLTQRGVDVVRFPIQKMLNTQPLGWSYFWRGLLAARKADIVHLHAPNLLASLVSLFIGSTPKLLVHWHSDIVGKGLLGRLVQPLEYLMLKRASVILATSQFYADGSIYLQKFITKVRVVPLGVPEPKTEMTISPLGDRLNQFLQGRRLVLSVGRLTDYKGFSVLVDAVNYLPSDVAVIIAGDGELMSKLAEQVRVSDISHKIFLAGRVTDEELRSLYQNADVFCLPSIHRSEAFGVVLLEAMAYGLPVVATKIAGSGVPWVNAHDVSGLNVDVGLPKELASACTQILDNPELRARFSYGARDRYEANFTEKLFAEKVVKIYSEMF
ncbi:glycosyltransferase family 4 protein [soil metagenome]